VFTIDPRERRTPTHHTANLLVLKFPESDGAYRMLDKLEDLQKHELIHIEDTAVVFLS
jgi:uncharacterized membrane protein